MKSFIFNVYGPYQICGGKMSTVIGIFENQYLNNKTLTVKTWHSIKRFTHINDTVEICYIAWKKCVDTQYSSKYSFPYSRLQNV